MAQQSNHLPGDVAPLPSPNSKTAPVEQYFPSFPAATTHTSNQSQHPHFCSGSQYHGAAQPSAQYHQAQGLYQQQHSSEPQHASSPALAPPQSYPALESQQVSGSRPSMNYHLQQPPASLHLDSSLQQQAPPQQPSQQQQPYVDPVSKESEANNHLRDFSLLAEAAKRAQVAVVARDMEEISL